MTNSNICMPTNACADVCVCLHICLLYANVCIYKGLTFVFCSLPFRYLFKIFAYAKHIRFSSWVYAVRESESESESESQSKNK